MKNPFASLNALFITEKPPERRFIRHPQEREIIENALNNLSMSDKGQELIDFVNSNDLKITVLRGQHNREFTPNKTNAYLTISESTHINDPSITIHMIGAIREAMHEHDPMLKKVSYDQGESIYVQREERKLSDKLQYQTIIVYELGKIANKSEFIDSFLLMGYYDLIVAYEKDLNE